ncbi:MAG TPA: hypothetical protein VIA18_05080 [Polyangia bacterium]|jgi:hypothetical protein|nr:hypothetical protein [Polyangia bacterium]
MAVSPAPLRHPFAPGKSPFHVKGVVYRNFVAYIDTAVAGGLARLVTLIDDPALQTFAQQPFLASSFYDALPTVPLCETAAKVLNQPFALLVRDFSAYAAERDAKGIYRLLLKLVSPDKVMERTPATAKQYFDFVDVTVERGGAKSFRTTVRGVPRFVTPFYMTVTEAFLSQALTLAGAKDPRHAWQAPLPDGERDGVPLLLLRREVSWR